MKRGREDEQATPRQVLAGLSAFDLPGRLRSQLAFHKRLADLYGISRHEPAHPAVFKSYVRLIGGLGEQYELVRRAGVVITFTETDPYETAQEMFADIENGRLAVYTEGILPLDHPMVSPSPFGVSWNSVFRAVHDYFGHFGGPSEPHYPFGARALIDGGDGLWDEEAAFQRHRKMFQPVAHMALVCETRAQTACNNLLRPPGGFVEQKACYLPSWTYEL